MKHGSARSTLTRLVPGCTFLLCMMISSQLAAEIYKWTDENGVTHFSETPPPSDQEAEIQDIPEFSGDNGLSLPPNGNLEDADSPAPELSAADQRRQELAASRAANAREREATERLCQNIRMRLDQIEPSRRVFYTDEEGETVRMDDEQRVAEVERLKEIQRQTCQ